MGSLVADIYPNAFYNTAFLNDPQNRENGLLYLRNQLVEIDKDATVVNIKDGITRICRDAAKGSKLTEIIIPDSVTYIGEGAFKYNHNVTDIYFGNSVEYIGDNAFSKIGNIHIKSVEAWCRIQFESNNSNPAYESLNARLFLNDEPLNHLVIPQNCAVTDKRFKSFKNIESVIISEATTEIPQNAFFSCTALRCVVIPDTVTAIGSYAFSSSVKYVLFEGSLSELNEMLGSSNPGLSSAEKIGNATPRTFSFVTNSSQSLEPITGYFIPSMPEAWESGMRLTGWYKNADDARLNKDPVLFPYGGEATTLYAGWERTEITASITATDGRVLTAKIPLDYPKNSKVLVCCYKNQRLTEIKIFDLTDSDINVTASTEFDENKIMIFQSLGSLAPLCPYYVATDEI